MTINLNDDRKIENEILYYVFIYLGYIAIIVAVSLCSLLIKYKFEMKRKMDFYQKYQMQE